MICNSIEEYYNEVEKSHRFYLSELKNISEKDMAYLVELMRACQHIKEVGRLTCFLSPDDLEGPEAAQFEVENESLSTMILNISAAQLREALILFDKFTKRSFYKLIYDELSENEKEPIRSLIKLNEEFSNEKGFIYEVLRPLRDLVFHYQKGRYLKNAVSWIREQKKQESERKPRYQSICLEEYEFGPGIEFDKYIYLGHLFWGTGGNDSLMEQQKKVWETQNCFLNAVKIIVEQVLRKEGISKDRKHDWYLKYWHGFQE